MRFGESFTIFNEDTGSIFEGMKGLGTYGGLTPEMFTLRYGYDPRRGVLNDDGDYKSQVSFEDRGEIA